MVPSITNVRPSQNCPDASPARPHIDAGTSQSTSVHLPVQGSPTETSSITAIAHSHLALYHLDPLYNYFKVAEQDAIEECKTTEKTLTALQQFNQELISNFTIPNSNFVATLQQLIGEQQYNEICALISPHANEGQLLLKQNIRNLLGVRDRECRNPIEQIIAFHTQKLELLKTVASLNNLGSLLAQAQKSIDTLQQGVLLDKATETFKKLADYPRGVICEKIWRLDHQPRRLNYGYEKALTEIQNLLSYKGTNLIQEAINNAQLKLKEGLKLSVDLSYFPRIKPSDLKSKPMFQKLMDLYCLEDLNLLARQNPKEVYEKFKRLSPELRGVFYKLFWLACNKPSTDPKFGENFIDQNRHLLINGIRSLSGLSLLKQMLEHCREIVKLQREIVELEQFILSSGNKTSQELLSLFNNLSEKNKEGLRYQVWYENGGKSNREFGEPNYGFNRIASDPLSLFAGTNPFSLYLSSLREKMAQAHPTLLEDFERKCTIPDHPIDVSTNRLLQNPELLQYLPADLRAVFITAEFAKVANVGGLAPAIDGLARGLSPKSRVIMPLYCNDRCGPISQDLLANKREKPGYEVTHQWKKYKVFKVYVNGIRVYLIDAPEVFWIPQKADGTAGNFYNDHDWLHTARRWAIFQSLAEQVAFKMSQKEEHPIELVHCNDGQTGLIPELFASRHPQEWMEGKTPAVVSTFHNNRSCQAFEYDPRILDILPTIGLPRQNTNSAIKALEVSDVNTTVSETFGKEMQTSFFGNGIDPFVKTAAWKGKFFGIVNGNSNDWNPTRNEQLAKRSSVYGSAPLDLRFGPDSPHLDQTLITAQTQLCATLRNFPFNHPAHADLDPSKPIALFFGRGDTFQKGIGKFYAIAEEILNNDGQIVIVYVEPDHHAYGIFEDLKRLAKERGKKGILVLEDPKIDGKYFYQVTQGLGPLLRAACNVAIFPSEFEPCGLVQGEMNRFGKKVVATATGGFVDTLQTEGPDANAYLFRRCSEWHSFEQDEEIKHTIRAALNDAKKMQQALYYGTEEEKRPFIEQMRTIMRNALNSTWEKTPDETPSAITKYEFVYAEAFRRRQLRGLIMEAELKTFKNLPQ